MNIEYITVARAETKDGKEVSIEASVDHQLHRAVMKVADYDKLQATDIGNLLRALAVDIEKV